MVPFTDLCNLFNVPNTTLLREPYRMIGLSISQESEPPSTPVLPTAGGSCGDGTAVNVKGNSRVRYNRPLQITPQALGMCLSRYRIRFYTLQSNRLQRVSLLLLHFVTV